MTRTHRPLIGLLTGAALGVALLVAAPRTTRACGGPDDSPPEDPEPSVKVTAGRSAVHLGFHSRDLQFKGGGYRFGTVTLYSRDRAFAAWLKEQGKSDAMWTALKGAVEGFACHQVSTGSGLVRAEAALGRAVARLYTARTKRAVSAPDVMLNLDVLELTQCTR